eukprot:4521280-Prymnesium_polylepis.1
MEQLMHVQRMSQSIEHPVPPMIPGDGPMMSPHAANGAHTGSTSGVRILTTGCGVPMTPSGQVRLTMPVHADLALTLLSLAIVGDSLSAATPIP